MLTRREIFCRFSVRVRGLCSARSAGWSRSHQRRPGPLPRVKACWCQSGRFPGPHGPLVTFDRGSSGNHHDRYGIAPRSSEARIPHLYTSGGLSTGYPRAIYRFSHHNIWGALGGAVPEKDYWIETQRQDTGGAGQVEVKLVEVRQGSIWARRFSLITNSSRPKQPTILSCVVVG